MEYDNLLEKYLPNFGLYHWKTLLTFATLAGPTAVILTEAIFQAAVPSFSCVIPNLTFFGNNTGGTGEKDQCMVNAGGMGEGGGNGIGNGTTTLPGYIQSNGTECTDWAFDTSNYGWTIVTQWSLVCSRDWVPAAVQSAVMAGLMVGVFISGLLSDQYGRRPVSLTCFVLCLAARVVNIFSPNYMCFIATKFLMSSCIIGWYTPAYIACMESVSPSYWFMFAVIMQSSFGITLGLMSVIAYFIKDWFTLTLTYTVFIIPYFAFFKLMSESPRWLLCKGRENEAIVILKKIVKLNGRELPEDIKLKVPSNDGSHHYSIFDLCRRPIICMYLFINIYIWNVDVMVFYGLTLNSVSLFGNLYWNVAAGGLIELPAYGLCHLLSTCSLGRRATQAFFLVLAGVCVVGAHFVPQGMDWLSLVLFLISKLAITSAFCITYIFTPELFPTSLRNRALGICSQLGRTGAILGPFIGRLAHVWEPFPEVLIGTAAVSAGLLTLLLPETRGHHLPQTLEDSEQLRRSKRSQLVLDVSGSCELRSFKKNHQDEGLGQQD